MKKVFLSTLFVILLALTGCTKKTEAPAPGTTKAPVATTLAPGTTTAEPAQSIESVLRNAKNQDSVKVEGTVFGVVSTGFYITDSDNGKIFVLWQDNSLKAKVGDRVEIVGKFTYITSFPQIRPSQNFTVLSSDASYVCQSSKKTIAEIKALDETERVGVYAMPVTLTGNLEKNEAGKFLLLDEDGNSVELFESSNLSVFEEWNTKRVELNVIVHQKNTEGVWLVSYVGDGSDIVEAAYTEAEFKALVKQYLDSKMPEEVMGALNLPQTHNKLTSVAFTWTVEANAALTIAENNAVIDINITEDTEATLTASFTNGTYNCTLEYKVLCKKIVERTVAELSDELISGSVVKVRGVVVAKSRNQGANMFSLIIADETTQKIATADFDTAAEIAAYNLNDIVVVTGKYRNKNGSTDRRSISSILNCTLAGHSDTFELDLTKAIVLSDEQSYNDFANKMTDEYENVLVKLENPWMSYSTTAAPVDTNWVRLGFDAESVEGGYKDAQGNTHSFAFLIANNNNNLGGTAWQRVLDIPLLKNAKEYQNTTIYAFATNYSGTYLQFMIPSLDYVIVPVDEKVAMELGNVIPTDVEEGAQLTLPASVGTNLITWSSSDPDVIAIDGQVASGLSQAKEVTLTATFTVDEVEHSVDFVINVALASSMSVSQILALDTEKVVKGEGVVIGYFGYNADKTSMGDVTAKQWTRFGIMLMDPETGEILLVRALSAISGSGSFGAYKDMDGNDIAIGSVVEMRGNFYLNDEQISSSGSHPQTGKKVVVMSTDCNSYLSVKGTKTAEELSALFASAPAITVTTDGDLQDVASHINENYGKLIKLVGTAENPIFIGGSSSQAGYTKFNFRIFKNASAQVKEDAMYAGWDGQNRIFGINDDVNKPNSGSDSDTWYSDLFDGVTGRFVGPKDGVPPIGYTGTIYVVPTTLTSAYYFLSIVNYSNCDLTPLATE